MRILFYMAVIAIACLIAQLFLPWWWAAIVCFVVGLFIKRMSAAFISGLALGLLWLIAALYLDNANHSILSQKINRLLSANAFFLTTLVGGVVGGMACASGAVLWKFYSSLTKKQRLFSDKNFLRRSDEL